MMKNIAIVWILLASVAHAQSSSVKVWDGTRTSTVRDTGASDSLNVAIVDGSGNQVTTFGGGTQYAEDAALGSVPTGTLSIVRRTDTLGTLTPIVDDAVSLRCNNRGALWVRHDGALTVDGSAVTQPISGSVTCNAGTNLNTSALATEATLSTLNSKVTACNTGAVVVSSAPTTAVTGTFFQATQPVSGTVTVTDGAGALNTIVDSGSLTCNAGTNLNTSALATVAKQPALGTAGAAAADVISVQGIASMTPLLVNGSAVTQPVSIAGNQSVNISQMNGVATTMDNGVSGTGVQRVTLASNSTGVVGLSTGANVIGALTANQSVNQTQVNGVAVSTGNGVTGTGTQRVSIASDSTGTVVLATGAATIGALSANQSVNQTQVNGVAVLAGNGVAGTGAQRVTIASDNTAFTVNAAQSGTWTVQPGNTANTTPWLVSAIPTTAGGLTTYHLISAATTNATVVKASAGQLYGWYLYNSNAAARKLAFHNTAATPTAGASIFFTVTIPAGAGANVEFTNGIPFSAGIAITTVTGLADADSAAVALNDLNINLFYR